MGEPHIQLCLPYTSKYSRTPKTCVSQRELNPGESGWELYLLPTAPSDLTDARVQGDSPGPSRDLNVITRYITTINQFD